MTEPNQRRRQPDQPRAEVATRGATAAMERYEQRKEQVGRLAAIVKGSGPVFAKLLPSHIGVETFMSSAGAALYRNEDLMLGAMNDPEAFMIALRESAALGHIPGTDHYWLTPRKSKGQPSVLGIEGYQGIVERMYRAGGVLAVRCRIVRANDMFDPDGGPGFTPVHKFGGSRGAFSTRSDRGEIIGVYAYALLPGAVGSQVVLMNMEDLMEHRAEAMTKAVWDKWPEAMYRKTALRGLEAYVPTSVEYRQAMDRRTAMIAAVAPTQPAPGRAEIEAGADVAEGDAPGESPGAAVPVGADQPGGGGVPVTDVPYNPQDWSDDAAWADLPVARPGEVEDPPKD